MFKRPILRTAVTLAVVAGLTAFPGLPGSALAGQRPMAKKPVAEGYDGAVVSDTAEATQAGIDVLRRGGTAADAAVAVAATLGVTDPYMAGLGGGGYFVYYDARTKKITTLDGRETTPAAATDKLFIDPATGKPREFETAVQSGLSVGVPGMLATWEQAVRRWGRLSLADNLRPAERVAEHGFVVYDELAKETAANAAKFASFTTSAKIFLPGGQPLKAGSVLRNPELAETYRQIGRQGTRAFYGGSIGKAVVDAVQNPPVAKNAAIKAIPGSMKLSDLRDYRVIERAPTRVNYRGYDVYGMAPSSSGGMTVGMTLNTLSSFDLSRMDKTQAQHHVIEAARLAYADRNRYIGDPAYVKVPQQQLLSKDFAASRACLIDPKKAGTSPVAPGDPNAKGCATGSAATAPVSPEQHTNHFVVTDRWGNVVSYTNTIESVGGSGITVGGFLLNNELTDFNFAPTQGSAPDPNLPAAGKRPRSSMSPTIVLRDGKPVLAIGSPGGATIITTVLQILVNRIDFGMTLPQAITAPRMSQRNSAKTDAEPAYLAQPAANGLLALGHNFNQVSGIGTAAGLEFLPHGKILAVGEPVRRGGTAAAVVSRR